MASPLDLIDTIIVVLTENRSFDHMVGYLGLPGPRRLPVEGVSADADWLKRHANSGVEPFAMTTEAIPDPPHEQKTIALQIGAPSTPGGPCPMNGFVESYRTANPPDNRLVMGYYKEAQVPTFDFFAHSFTVCDHWFASLPTGTQANRLMAMGGATTIIDNAPIFLPDQPLVYDWLTERGVSWCAYQAGGFLPFFSLMRAWQDEIAVSLALDALVPHAHPRFRRFSNFARDWSTEQSMPSVIFIEPEYTDGPHVDPNDDHPPTGILAGQQLLASIYSSIIGNPARWRRTVLIVTYDEHGGFFDHVPPLDIPTPLLGHGMTPVFTTTGVRVPGFIISPLVDADAVFHGALDHTSILQFIADKFGGGFYSGYVSDRQPALARIASALTRSEPRIDLLSPNAFEAPPPAAPATTQRAPGANANAAAFRLAAAKIAADHPGITSGWPELAKAAKS